MPQFLSFSVVFSENLRFPRLGRKRHGVDTAAGGVDGQLLARPGGVLPNLPGRRRAA